MAFRTRTKYNPPEVGPCLPTREKKKTLTKKKQKIKNPRRGRSIAAACDDTPTRAIVQRKLGKRVDSGLSTLPVATIIIAKICTRERPPSVRPLTVHHHHRHHLHSFANSPPSLTLPPPSLLHQLPRSHHSCAISHTPTTAPSPPSTPPPTPLFHRCNVLPRRDSARQARDPRRSSRQSARDSSNRRPPVHCPGASLPCTHATVIDLRSSGPAP